MADHLTEEEQIEALKQWWKDNWTFIVIPVVLAGSLYYGWAVWQQKKEAQAESGSVIYQQLIKALETTPGAELSDQQRTQAESLASEIAETHAGSLYADNGNLILARLAVEKQELSAAEGYIQRVVDNGTNESIKDLAKARLARVKLAQSKFDEALALVSSAADSEYKSMFAEIRGDALAGQGNSGAAKTAYEEAVESLPERQFSRQSILQLKIDGVEILAGTIQPGSPAVEENIEEPETSEIEAGSSETPLATSEENS